MIVPGALVVTGVADAPALAVVVDPVEHPNGTIVYLDALPGAIDAYVALAGMAFSLARKRPASN